MPIRAEGLIATQKPRMPRSNRKRAGLMNIRPSDVSTFRRCVFSSVAPVTVEPISVTAAIAIVNLRDKLFGIIRCHAVK